MFRGLVMLLQGVSMEIFSPHKIFRTLNIATLTISDFGVSAEAFKNPSVEPYR